MSTEQQIAANRRNAQLSTGPHDTSTTRGNATRHGLLAKGVTPLDQAAYDALAGQLIAHLQPEGALERWLVEQIALLMVRLNRAVQIEQELLNVDMADNRLFRQPCTLNAANIRIVHGSVGRYETALENRLYRAMHELERMQRARRGEHVPAPAAGDLTVHGADAAGATVMGLAAGANLVPAAGG